MTPHGMISGTIPSRAELEKALVNEGFEDELCSLVGQLLAICIVDPGLQNSRDASTVTGQHLRVCRAENNNNNNNDNGRTKLFHKVWRSAWLTASFRVIDD